MKGMIIAMKTYKEVIGEILYPVMTGQQTPISVSVNDSGQKMAGIKSSLLYYDADVNVELACLTGEYYRVIPMPFADAYNYESEAMGQKINCSEFGVPDNDQENPLIKSEADFDKIKWPDEPLKSGQIPTHIKTLELMEKYTGLPTMVYRGIASPFSVACAICSFKAVNKMARRKPEQLHILLTKITDEITIPYIKAIAYRFPGINIKLADAWELVPNVSPQVQEEFAFTYFDRVLSATKELNCTIDFYNSYGEKYFADPKAYLKRKLDYTSTIHLSGSYGDDVPYSVYHETVLDTGAAIWASISASDIFAGPPKVIIEKVRRLVAETRSGVDPTKYILVGLAGTSRPEHIKATIDAFNTFSQLPVPEDFGKIQVDYQPIEMSFETFVKNKAKENPDGYTFKWLDDAKF